MSIYIIYNIQYIFIYNIYTLWAYIFQRAFLIELYSGGKGIYSKGGAYERVLKKLSISSLSNHTFVLSTTNVIS